MFLCLFSDVVQELETATIHSGQNGDTGNTPNGSDNSDGDDESSQVTMCRILNEDCNGGMRDCKATSRNG